MMVILSSLSDSYIINGDGSTRTAAQISAPSNDFADRAQSAVVADKLYLFGGSNDFRKVSIFLFFSKFNIFFKIARLESCTIVELTVKLNNDFGAGHCALATADNSQGFL